MYLIFGGCIMAYKKREYERVSIEVIYFSEEDVIVSSHAEMKGYQGEEGVICNELTVT